METVEAVEAITLAASVVTAVGQLTQITNSVVQGVYGTGLSFSFFTKYYGVAGAILWMFGSPDVCRIQVQVLRSANEQHALDFKSAAQEESNIIAVTVSPYYLTSREAPL